MNALADHAADLARGRLAEIRRDHGAVATVASALAVALTALGFIREAAGDLGAEGATDMLGASIRLGLDRARPVREVAR